MYVSGNGNQCKCFVRSDEVRESIPLGSIKLKTDHNQGRLFAFGKKYLQLTKWHEWIKMHFAD
jgi:hypothetical protein